MGCTTHVRRRNAEERDTDLGDGKGRIEGGCRLRSNAVLALYGICFISSLETTMPRALSLEKDLSTEKTSRFRVLELHTRNAIIPLSRRALIDPTKDRGGGRGRAV